MIIMGMCGTVSSHNGVKKTFEYLLTRAAEDTLERILCTNFRDTIIVVKK